MKKILGILAITALATLFGVPETSEARGVYVRFGPPPVKQVVVVKRARPFPRAVWVSGHYKFRHGRYVWAEGYWIKPRRGHVFVQPHWTRTSHGHVFVPGHWVKR